MPKITALSNIKHDGKSYGPGEQLDVTKEQSEYLISLGAAKAGGSADKKPTASEKAAADKAAGDAKDADANKPANDAAGNDQANDQANG